MRPKKVAESIVSFFSDTKNKEEVERLLKVVSIKSFAKKNSGSLEGLTFVITGTLPTLSRDDAKKLIEDNGGKVSSSVSSKTAYLLAGENAGSKLVDAEKLGIKVISEEDLIKIMEKSY